MYISARAVRALPGYRLLITFDNDEQRRLDMTPYLSRGVFQELRSIPLFSSVHLSFDTVAWANGADLCPEILYRDSVPVEMEHAAVA
jgi:hypothetical protein